MLGCRQAHVDLILNAFATADANWIESANSVMDDNRLLTLPSNERIRLLPHMKVGNGSRSGGKGSARRVVEVYESTGREAGVI